MTCRLIFDRSQTEVLRLGNLVSIVQKMWNEESLLDDWSTEVVVPIHKSDGREDFNNYRMLITALSGIQDLRGGT